MKYIKYFAIFESKTHALTLPKNESELEDLRRSPGFQILKNFTAGRHGCGLKMTRNGGVEISSPVGYNFKVSPSGTFYYGGLKVGPKYDTNLDTWDKLFDYVYLYFLGTGLSIAPSAGLENFVFHGVINPSLYIRINDNIYYQSILDLARKYVGEAADRGIANVKNESGKYIDDPHKVLETPSYKFFDKVFGFVPEITENGVRIDLNNKTPFGIFDDLNLKLPGYFGSKIYMYFPGFGGSNAGLVKVKTMKGLDQNFLKKITETYEGASNALKGGWYNNRKDSSLEESLAGIMLEIFRTCINNYKEGKEAKSYEIGEFDNAIAEAFYKWKKSDEDYIKSLVSLINIGKFDSAAEEISHSEKTIDVLNSLKSESITKYAGIMRDLRDVPFIKDAIKNTYDKNIGVIKGGNLLGRFGL
jgi:hypothetical protein